MLHFTSEGNEQGVHWTCRVLCLFMVEALKTISLEPPKLAVCCVCIFALYTQHVPIQCGVFQSGDVSPFVVLHESNSVLHRTITAHRSTSILHPGKPPPRHVYLVMHSTVWVLLVNIPRGWFIYNLSERASVDTNEDQSWLLLATQASTRLYLAKSL